MHKTLISYSFLYVFILYLDLCAISNKTTHTPTHYGWQYGYDDEFIFLNLYFAIDFCEQIFICQNRKQNWSLEYTRL